ncbi:hypothetical protein HAX54_043984 [Datura stramonium]|uniref:Uncharacterized protein n=1 Tax=Datura stramonium TaxID=4076 RepID=A0ABS8W377_DATST|nr:hypothetical protein [Datura stramonium]
MAEHYSGDENVSKKRKIIANTPDPKRESIPQTTSETVHQTSKICSLFWCKGRALHNLLMSQVHDNEDEVLHFLVSGAKLRFDLGEFSLITGLRCKGSTFIKKELNDFRLHVDVKFGEILQALAALTKKLEEKKMDECAYFGGRDAYKVALDSTPKVCEVGVGGEKTGAGKGGVDVGESSRDVNVKEQVSQSYFNFLFMRESAIATITQDYYKNKAGAQQQERDLKLNSEKTVGNDFFVDMSESEITLITQATIGAARVNMNVAISDQAVRDGAAHSAICVAVEADDTVGSVAGVRNESTSRVFAEDVDVNESVVASPSKDVICEPMVA